MLFIRTFLIIWACQLCACRVNNQALPAERIIDAEIFAGRINDVFADNIDQYTKSGDTIIITSQGGEHEASIKIANIIMKRRLDVIVLDYCISACAVILLPAANSIEFLNEPLIGYHWDSMLLSSIIRDKAGSLSANCDFHHEQDQILLYKNTNHNINFWKTVRDKIKITDVKVHITPKKCPSIEITQLENDLWLPTSSQLKTGLNLKFTGAICADDHICYEQKIPKFWAKKAQYLIGNKQFNVDPMLQDIKPKIRQ